MRDAKDALRHQVRALEEELAEKEAELAQMRRQQEQGPESEPAPEPAPKKKKKRAKRDKAVSSEPPEIRLGAARPDGSVRYIVRPIDKVWVTIMSIVAVAMASAIVGGVISDGQAGEFPWLALTPILLLPVALTFRAGFDVDVAKKKIFVWESWGPFTTMSFKLHRLKMPELRTRMETAYDSESRGRVTRLYWGNKNVRATLESSQLSDIMSEVRALIDSARD